jgi:hypothetical protein
MNQIGTKKVYPSTKKCIPSAQTKVMQSSYFLFGVVVNLFVSPHFAFGSSSEFFQGQASENLEISQSVLPLEPFLPSDSDFPNVFKPILEFAKVLESDLEFSSQDLSHFSNDNFSAQLPAQTVFGETLLPSELSTVELFGLDVKPSKSILPDNKNILDDKFYAQQAKNFSADRANSFQLDLVKSSKVFKNLVDEGVLSSEIPIEKKYYLGASLENSEEVLESSEDSKLAFDLKNSSQESKKQESSGSVIHANFGLAASLKMRVLVPQGIDLSTVRVRISGTTVDLTPDNAGYIEFSGIHSESRLKAVVWDEDSKLARRVVDINFSSLEKVTEIDLVSLEYVNALSASFGEKQLFTQAGFCGDVDFAENSPEDNKNNATLVSVRSVPDSTLLDVKIFDKSGFPAVSKEQNIAQKQLFEDKRFCVFNIKSNVVEVKISSGYGVKRTFYVNVMPSTFDASMKFNMRPALYPNVMPWELVDSRVALASMGNENAEPVSFFDNADNRTWANAQDTPIWVKTHGVSVSGDENYSSLYFNESSIQKKSELQHDFDSRLYLPVGEGLSEVYFSKNETDGTSLRRSFSLINKNQVENSLKQSVPLNISTLTPDFIDGLNQNTLQNFNFDLDNFGSGFVNIDLQKMGLNYSDIKIKIVDNWTGESVGNIVFLQTSEGVKNPRFVRAVFGNLAVGDYSLVVANTAGAVKWIDVVRSRINGFQVINFQDF